mgnify:CR=1 FL=1
MKNKKLSAGQKSKERIKGKLSLLKRTMTGFAHKESNWLEDVDRSASCLRSVLNNEELTDKNGLDALERKYEHLENVKDMK